MASPGVLLVACACFFFQIGQGESQGLLLLRGKVRQGEMRWLLVLRKLIMDPPCQSGRLTSAQVKPRGNQRFLLSKGILFFVVGFSVGC